MSNETITFSTSYTSHFKKGNEVKIKCDDINRIEFYTGCRPHNIECAPTGRLIRVCLRGEDGVFASKINTESGLCGYFRVFNNSGKAVFDGIIATSGADINMVTGPSIVSGGVMTVKVDGSRIFDA